MHLGSPHHLLCLICDSGMFTSVRGFRTKIESQDQKSHDVKQAVLVLLARISSDGK